MPPVASRPRPPERHVCASVAWFDVAQNRGFIVTPEAEQFPFDRSAIRESGIALLSGERVVARIIQGRAVEVRRSVLY